MARISVDKDDPGYKIDAHKYQAYLNGVEISEVVTVDEDKGYLIRYKTDEKGELLLNEDRTEILQETRYGIVRAIIPSDDGI